jgi:antirestriction protein ArdC
MATKETKQVQWRELIETALTLEGSIGNTYNRFYDYSHMNQIMLMWQGVFEPIATYKRWQALGRQVKKGSTAKEIVRPIMRYLTDEEKKKLNIDTRDKVTNVVGFKPLKCVFKFSDTEGKDLPEVKIPAWNLKPALKELDIKEIPFKQLNGNIQGYSTSNTYAINPVASDPTATTMHELAHIVLGHTSKDNIHEYSEHRGIQEFQAEVTSFLLMNELAMINEKKASESRAYIQNWLAGEKPDDKAIRQVFTAVNKILKAGKEPVEK